MRTRDFELCVVGGHERLDCPEVELRHGQVYQLVLSNHGARQCDAAVNIDGKPVGTWRVPAQRQIVLEHPCDQTGKFTFFLVGTAEAKVTNIQENDFTGFVEATFTPEKQAPLPTEPAKLSGRASFLPTVQRSTKKDVGGTGLSGKSEQQYGTAETIEYDRTSQITIRVRLVPLAAHLNELQPLGAIQPPVAPAVEETRLPAKSTKVPWYTQQHAFSSKESKDGAKEAERVMDFLFFWLPLYATGFPGRVAGSQTAWWKRLLDVLANLVWVAALCIAVLIGLNALPSQRPFWWQLWLVVLVPAIIARAIRWMVVFVVQGSALEEREQPEEVAQ